MTMIAEKMSAGPMDTVVLADTVPQAASVEMECDHLTAALVGFLTQSGGFLGPAGGSAGRPGWDRLALCPDCGVIGWLDRGPGVEWRPASPKEMEYLDFAAEVYFQGEPFWEVSALTSGPA